MHDECYGDEKNVDVRPGSLFLFKQILLGWRVSEAFEDHFGIRPLEGYGCTECSPAVTVNTRDFRAAGFRQVGARFIGERMGQAEVVPLA